MPDIDMDFDERRRGEMIRYATEKYGEERVAQIVTYSTIKAKAALKDSARVLGQPFAVGEQLTKAMPPSVMGKDIPLSGIFDAKDARYKEAGDFRALVEAEPELKAVVDTARGLEGLRRQWGVHAAGVILSAEPLLDVVPIMRREQDGADHHAAGHGRLRVARPAQDGLPGPAQPHDPRRRAAPHRGQPRRDGRSRGAAARRQADLRAALPRRHAGRVPAGQLRHARAAHAAGSDQLRGHLRGAGALPAGADGRQRAQRLRRPEERPPAGQADPPRARRAAGGDPGRHATG